MKAWMDEQYSTFQHELLRIYAVENSKAKASGKENDLLANQPSFSKCVLPDDDLCKLKHVVIRCKCT
jgi:hypothetical protein